jgi:hypothetical protein
MAACAKSPGVGEAIAEIITRLHRTGTHPGLEAMRKEIPAGVLEMLAIPGLRPEKVLKLYKELGITSLAALEEAAKADRFKGVKSLGPIRSVLFGALLFWLKLGKSSADSGYPRRKGRFLRGAFELRKKSFLDAAPLALVVFGLERARFDVDLAFVRLTLFFIINPSYKCRTPSRLKPLRTHQKFHCLQAEA